MCKKPSFSDPEPLSSLICPQVTGNIISACMFIWNIKSDFNMIHCFCSPLTDLNWFPLIEFTLHTPEKFFLHHQINHGDSWSQLYIHFVYFYYVFIIIAVFRGILKCIWLYKYILKVCTKSFEAISSVTSVDKYLGILKSRDYLTASHVEPLNPHVKCSMKFLVIMD